MDKETRNAIERATQWARNLLEEDFASQLEGDFDVHRDGVVAAKPSGHLSARQVLQRERIVAAIDHKRAAGMNASDAVCDYLRDAAFTTLNRFVALKMLEARELVQQCITKGEQSAGYREFCGMAQGLPLLPNNAGYRLYVESLFDELATEVKVLFDRRDPSSVLWPKRASFEQLLEILNASELARVWGEDETIGWVYQFFNGQDERRKMREESQAPRNSRELAVRNQFFTPRYVVQFLTDNTLGRIWYEMRGMNTVLAERCEYMVRKSGEAFEPRAKKDPRDLRLLDPACGSGHFLLYAFDLLLEIYEEAYADLESPKSEETGRTLAEDCPSLDALRRAVPGLILAHNLHGVDIDPRCAQIAQLALWMRAQKAYRDFGVGRAERLQVRRSNIVVAEPLVADDQIAKEFVAKLGDAELGRVFTGLVDALSLAGDLGLLLRVETLLASTPKRGQSSDIFAPPEERIRETLSLFIQEEGERMSTRRRLFANDAAHGIGLLEVAEKKYDVVVMNPPFGEPSLPSRATVYESSPAATADLGAAFIDRFSGMLRAGGVLGVLKSRALLFHDNLESWRNQVFLGGTLSATCLGDLGYGVLDAVVEVDAAVLANRPPGECVFISCLAGKDKGELLRAGVRGEEGASVYAHALDRFKRVPLSKIVYFLSDRWLDYFQNNALASWFTSKAGLASGDDERFVRAHWEVAPSEIASDRWRWFAKGGDFGRYKSDLHLVIRWGNHELFRRPGNAELYGRPGVTYTERTTSNLSVRALAARSSFSYAGPAIIPEFSESLPYLLFILNSWFVTYLVEALSGSGDHSVRGSAARHFYPSYFERIAIPKPDSKDCDWFKKRVDRLFATLSPCITDETDASFLGPRVSPGDTILGWSQRLERSLYGAYRQAYAMIRESEERIAVSVQLMPTDVRQGFEFTGWPWPSADKVPSEAAGYVSRYSPSDAAPPEAIEKLGGVRFANKLSHYLSASIESVAHAWSVSPEALCAWGEVHCVPSPARNAEMCVDLLQWSMGVAFGRWDIRHASSEVDAQESQHAFQQLPACAPGVLVGDSGLPVLDPPLSYPIAVPADGILVDDLGHQRDVRRAIQAVFECIFDRADDRLNEVAECLGVQSLSEWFARTFFNVHVKRYSKSRRKAPIYWQLATPSASYSIWLYVHSFSRDTLFRVQNDYAAPKLAHEERRLELLTSELRERATATQRKELAAQETLVGELRAFLEEVKRVAPLWNPNLDDGVMINFAPLWRLVPQNKSWQKELKSTWDALCEGKYDWSHLAMRLWPERVVPQSAKDRSVAIAHGLDDVFWVEGDSGKWTARKTPARSIDELVRERSSPAVKSALKSVLEAPAAAGNGTRGRGSRRRSTVTADGGDA
ncbi:hypothetical protein QA640_17780 [Bradyrhizobium sp. CB82]|uniref:Eco57I restriction-modification methylase domain-containing protein n=1 Tax=Bradyrhizobium sp. CB82 TaxID=3039159 RepID=UPI0024B0F19C|nr:DNA methyltransferase [Bradyrhizobium sp. CB82]WFU44133.1 hypothetical protein QA640_17780 [Bradyrhizobium sp. CB82]